MDSDTHSFSQQLVQAPSSKPDFSNQEDLNNEIIQSIKLFYEQKENKKPSYNVNDDEQLDNLEEIKENGGNNTARNNTEKVKISAFP